VTLRRCQPLTIFALSAFWLAPRPCLADESEAQNLATLSYSAPQKRRYLRLALEEVAVLGGGLAQYWYNRNANSRDWQFSYGWPALRDRIEGKAYAFDSNGFDTNFLFHPVAGTLYYLTARSNHLGPFESLAVAFSASFLWEFFGEFQEKPSVNDIIVTPFAGMAWGETTSQLGAYFFRACPSTGNEMLGSALAPYTALNDAFDGSTRVHSDCDAGGGTSRRIRLSLSGGEAWTEGISPYARWTAALNSEVIHLPSFARPGSGWVSFADGNVSRLGVNLSLDAGHARDITDFTLLTQTVLAGVHYRSNFNQDGAFRRSDVIFGLMIGAEYSRHRYQPGQSPDRLFLIDLPALTTRYYGQTRALSWELTLDAGGSFGGADSFAQPRALSRASATELTSVAKDEGYNHVAGITLSPRARFEFGPTEVGLDFRSDRLIAFRALDHTGITSPTPVSEFRRRASLWLASGAPWLSRFLLSANWTQRSGSVGDVRTTRNELSVNAGLELAP
jgi:hypothetical protein